MYFYNLLFFLDTTVYELSFWGQMSSNMHFILFQPQNLPQSPSKHHMQQLPQQPQFHPLHQTNNQTIQQNQHTAHLSNVHQCTHSSHVSDLPHQHQPQTISQHLACLQSLCGGHVGGRLHLLVRFYLSIFSHNL